MSTKQSAALEADETAQKRAQAEQFSFDVDAPGMVEVTNESHETPADHQYTVSIDDVTDELMACTCPHHVHRNAFCKHMAAVENAIDDGTLDAIRAVDGVSQATASGMSVAVTLESHSKAAVLNALEARGIGVDDFSTEETSLEDLFMVYTDGRSTAETTEVSA